MEEHLEIRGKRYFIKKEGSAEPIVFLHSSLITSEMWTPQLEEFRTSKTVIAYDLYGQGRSEVPETGYSQYQCLKEIIQHFSFERLDIVGCSFGASVAIDFCLAFPEMVKRMVLVTPSINGYRYPLRLTMKSIKNFQNCKSLDTERGYELFEKEPFWKYFIPKQKEARELFRKIFVDNQAFYQCDPRQCSILKPTAIKRLDEIRSKVLIISADGDARFNKKVADILNKKIPDSRIIEIQGSGHLPNIEKPDEVNRAIEAFLSGE